MTAFDIVVVGRGPAGMASAAALATTGCRVALVGPASALPVADTRTAALFTGSMNLLRNIGATSDLHDVLAPLKGIRIVDDGDGWLRGPEVTFEASEIGLPDFGANVPQMPLGRALAHAVERNSQIAIIDAQAVGLTASGQEIRLGLDTGATLASKLVVAADGRNSACRSAAGIDIETWDYPQVAITAQFSHSRPHKGISTEFHRPAGPCTVVPMPGLRSSLVWVETPTIARKLAALDDAAFAAALEPRLHGVLGSLRDMGPRRQFPLSCLKARTLGRDRVVLVGESGHTLPPIGAQGLNLGLRDVAVLTDLVADAHRDARDIGAPDLIARYGRLRSLDIDLRSTAVDLLNRSLLADMAPADLARGFGMHALRAVGALKRQIMRAGFEPTGTLPQLMRA